MLVFLSIGNRRIEYLACTSKPNTDWMLQQARNLLMELDDRDRQVRFLIHDRNATFPRAFDALLAGEKIKVIRTPVQAPNANAHMERWVGSARRECLDRLLIVGRRQLEHVLRVYVRHYNARRPHRALDLQAPAPIGVAVSRYGALRITAELRFGRQIVVGHNAVASIMNELGIKGTSSGIRQPSSLTTRPITPSLADFSNEVGLRDHRPGPCLPQWALSLSRRALS